MKMGYNEYDPCSEGERECVVQSLRYSVQVLLSARSTQCKINTGASQNKIAIEM
jgi:hypothetical protein